MPSKIYSCALKGIDAYGVEIEVDILRGLSRFMVVGLGDTAVHESKERVRSALKSCGARYPLERKVVNLAPADTKKSGPLFDLPIAIGLLMESKQLPPESAQGALFVGELALDGSVRPVNGALAFATYAVQHGFRSLYLPEENVQEAQLVSGLTIYGVPRLGDLLKHLRGERRLTPSAPPRHSLSPTPRTSSLARTVPSLKSIWGAVRALAVASAGAHHLILSGPPGSGKTLLAQYLPHLLPPLAKEELIEITKIHSVAGLVTGARPFVSERPFRSLHHSSTMNALVGGGNPVRPGEISLAHRGVLFLDEVLEFPRSVLESLRQPLESRLITIGRSAGRFTFPANFILVGTMNPCPCGYLGDPHQKCKCTLGARRLYGQRLSGPLLDRIDLLVNMKRLKFDQLNVSGEGVNFEKLQQNVLRARKIQAERFKSSTRLNSDIAPDEVEKFCPVTPEGRYLLKKSVDQEYMSARGYHSVLKVARTLADLDDCRSIQTSHVLEALQYRLTPLLPVGNNV